MRNRINEAVDASQGSGVERLRDTGRLGYRAAVYQAPAMRDTGKALRGFGEAAASMAGSYRQASKAQAEARSDEIIRKLTPEQRREAIANGTLLYQDDADAMKALRFKTGRNAAYEVETEIRAKVAEGAFKTPEDLAEYRQTRLEDKAKSYAEASGIDSSDFDYQRGFNADIVDRSRAVFDAHAQKLSEERMAMAQMETTSDLGSMMSDESFLRSPNAASTFANYFTASLASGSIPTETMAVSALTQSLKDNAGQPGAEAFMRQIGDQSVVLYGKSVKVRDVLGGDVLDNLQVRADESAFKRSRETNQGFTIGLQDAVAQGDPTRGLQMLSGLQAKLDKMQPSGMVTDQSQAILAARGQLLARLRTDSAERVKLMDKQLQSDNRQNSFETAYWARIHGENISTDWRTYATNPNTGEFKEEDAANFAARKLSQIDSMNAPAEERDKLKLSYLRADFADGPFRKHFQTLTSDAVNQFKGLVTADSAEVSEQNTDRIRAFQRAYQADPATIASLYPEQAALAERISLMERNGLGLDTIIDSDRRSKGLSIEEQRLQDNKWMDLLKSSGSSLQFLPGPLRQAARTLYDSELFRTGDESNALATVNSWLDKSATRFTATSPLGADKNVGAIQKRSLMVDPQDASSWHKGRDIVKEMVSEVAKAAPWINESDITITETPNGIMLQDPSSSLNLPPITPAQLQQHYQLQQEKARKAAEEARQKAADEKTSRYQRERQRRSESPLGDLNPAIGTLEGAAGFRDR